LPTTVLKSSTPAGKHTTKSSEIKTLTVKPQSNLGCFHQTPVWTQYSDKKTLQKETQPPIWNKCLLFYEAVTKLSVCTRERGGGYSILTYLLHGAEAFLRS
jgi:hypothetical protein